MKKTTLILALLIVWIAFVGCIEHLTSRSINQEDRIAKLEAEVRILKNNVKKHKHLYSTGLPVDNPGW